MPADARGRSNERDETAPPPVHDARHAPGLVGPRRLRRALLALPLAALAACGAGVPADAPPPSPPPTASASATEASASQPTPPPAAESTPVPAATGPATATEPPRYLRAQPIDPVLVARVSRFRSGVGHDYSDASEACRSMKHYFELRPEVDASSLPLLAAADGDVTGIWQEWAGAKLALRPDAAPEERLVYFHVALAPGIAVGSRVRAGEVLGTHVGRQTLADLALERRTEAGLHLVSVFERMPDALFADWRARGVAGRAALRISRAERDAAPLSCAEEHGAFLSPASPTDWLVLDAAAGGASR